MMFRGEVVRAKDLLQVSARLNTLSFLEKYSIDRDILEAMIGRVCPVPSDIYYVSTVPAGLAGSKSDLDTILVPRQVLESEPLSSMLFQQGRRVGTKVIPETVIEAALTRLRGFDVPTLLTRGALQEAYAPIPIKWEDLERIVNGVSLDRGARYSQRLDDVLAYATARALANYRQYRYAAMLSHQAEQHRAMLGYASLAMLYAMDALMSCCGQIQSNAKWILQRWSRFSTYVPEVAAVGAARSCIDTAWRAVSRGNGNPRELLASVGAMFSSTFDLQLETCTLHAVKGTIVMNFLPGAVCLISKNNAAVAPATLIQNVAGVAAAECLEALSIDNAATLVELLQLDLLETGGT